VKAQPVAPSSPSAFAAFATPNGEVARAFTALFAFVPQSPVAANILNGLWQVVTGDNLVAGTAATDPSGVRIVPQYLSEGHRQKNRK